MRDRPVTSPAVIDNEDGHLVAYVAADDVMRGLVTGLRDAMRAGAPVVLRRSYFSTSSRTGALHAFDTVQIRLRALRRDLTAAQTRARRADDAYLSAEDDDAAAKWAARSRKETEAVKHLTQQLEGLLAEPQESDPGDVIEVHGAPVEAACRRLLSGGDYTQQDRDALLTIFPELRMSQGSDGQWTGHAVARLPGAEGSVEVGPFAFHIGSGGYGSQTMRSLLPPPPSASRARGSRSETYQQLLELGLCAEAARTLQNSVFTEMPHVVLWASGAGDLPGWVGTEWRDEAWAAWLLQVYADPEFRYLGNGQYVRLSPTRQAVVDVVAARGGSADTPTLAMELPTLPRATVWSFARPKSDGRHIRPWGPVISDTGSNHKGNGTMRVALSKRCPEGHIATIVARVPEMPGDLLCECGLPVGMVDGLLVAPRAPEPYQQLRMSEPHWRASLAKRREQTARASVRHTQRTLAILADPALLLAAGVTTKELANNHRKSPSDMHTALANLETQGLLRRSGYRPARWSLTSVVPTQL